MKKLTKKDLTKLTGFCRTPKQRETLDNGETGYYKPKKILITCCSNCGDYIWVKIKGGLKL